MKTMEEDINEELANRVLAILDDVKGNYHNVNPNDYVT